MKTTIKRSKYVFVADYKRDVMKLIKALRKRKGTYKEISDFLNTKGIQTFSGHGKWHSQTVHRLLQ